jgi:hypothetical protein
MNLTFSRTTHYFQRADGVTIWWWQDRLGWHMSAGFEWSIERLVQMYTQVGGRPGAGPGMGKRGQRGQEQLELGPRANGCFCVHDLSQLGGSSADSPQSRVFEQAEVDTVKKASAPHCHSGNDASASH